MDIIIKKIRSRLLAENKKNIFRKRRKILPAIDELYELWPIVFSHQRALRGINPNDPYFDPATTLECVAKWGIIQKNLFEIWYFLNHEPASIIEIGPRSGLSLVNKLSFLSNPDSCVVLCFDMFIEQGSPEIIQNNLKFAGLPTSNIFFIAGDSKVSLPMVMSKLIDVYKFDYALVDGAHDQETVRYDLNNVLPHINPGGCVILDDTGPVIEGMKNFNLIEVWDSVMENYADEYVTHHYDAPNGFCVAQRKPITTTA